MLKNKIVVAKNKMGIKKTANMYFITEKYIKKQKYLSCIYMQLSETDPACCSSGL